MRSQRGLQVWKHGRCSNACLSVPRLCSTFESDAGGGILPASKVRVWWSFQLLKKGSTSHLPANGFIGPTEEVWTKVRRRALYLPASMCVVSCSFPGPLRFCANGQPKLHRAAGRHLFHCTPHRRVHLRSSEGVRTEGICVLISLLWPWMIVLPCYRRDGCRYVGHLRDTLVLASVDVESVPREKRSTVPGAIS